jgi:hypothetical protein
MPPSTTNASGKSPMAHEITTGTILIKNGAPLPIGLQFETEAGVPGWRFVKGFDAPAMNRAIQKTGWTYFCLAGEIKTTVFGIDTQRMVRTAIARILIDPRSENCNSLEITRLVSVGSARFPLVHYVTVSAQSRHIQESIFLGGKARPELKTKKFEPPAAAQAIAGEKKALAQEPAKHVRAASV